MTALAIQYGCKISSPNGHALLSESEVGKGIAADFHIGAAGPSAIWIFSEIFAFNLARERCFSLALLSRISVCRAEIGGKSKVNQQTEDVFVGAWTFQRIDGPRAYRLSRSHRQLLQQRLRFLEIARVEPIRKPPVYRSQQFARLLRLALVASLILPNETAPWARKALSRQSYRSTALRA
jgi:hypothetical protein